jgi:hypothetical protein
MTFISELGKILPALYSLILGKNGPKGISVKTLNCDSFEKVIATIKSILIDSSNN